ncbi:MAG: DUF3772 domain-containing protein [Enterobacteriaceae bacterium]|nr:DUF3772 domain-containing protein [Enterobacteriaceae bacterium]
MTHRFSRVLLLCFSLIMAGVWSPSSMAGNKSNSTAVSSSVTNKASNTSANTSDNSDDVPPAAGEPKTVKTADLDQLQKQLNDIKQQVSTTLKDHQLSVLNNQAIDVASQADSYMAILLPNLDQINTQLDVVGAKPVDGTLQESPEVTKKRNGLKADKAATEKQLDYAQTLKTTAINLSKQIVELRRSSLKTQLALDAGSILNARFWAPIFNPQQDDVDKFHNFCYQIRDAWQTAWQPEAFWGSLSLMLLAVAIWFGGRRLLEKGLVWFSISAFPDGRLRRSFLACATAIVTVVAITGGANLIYLVFARESELTPLVQSFANSMLALTTFSALIAGLGRSLLSIQRPSWRLMALPDAIAHSLRRYPAAMAIILMTFGTIEQMNSVIGTSVSSTIFGNGISSLLMGLLVWSATLRTNKVRRNVKSVGGHIDSRSTISGLIHLTTTLVSLTVLFALLIGYIPLARFLTYELVWFAIVLSCLYLLTKFVGDMIESLFSEHSASGRWIKQAFNLDSRYLEQATILFSAASYVLLILFALIALLNGTYGSTTPMTILDKVIEIMGSDSFGKINIVPADVFNAIICMIGGLYLLRSARRWLSNKFLPKTAMDTGMRMSIVTLFSNIGYVLLILITLSVLGIEWNKLAWIVSALSVGIGFGLQEIVKNFISGLILLTERPVKVGDLISISGVEGDIRRINVRATEIQLTDKSTVIVPNSQLISQNVRNVTMGHAQGVVTIPLTFPLDIDPEQVRGILLQAYAEHASILDTPAPSVTFSQLAPDGITLSVTGYVTSPRIIKVTKSDLLFDILKRLRAANVKLSSPQSLVVQNIPPDIAVAYSDNSQKESE